MTVVVSGFGPWGSIDENPTELVLERLAGIRGLVTLLLPVDTARLERLVTDAIERHRPDVWLGLGLAYGSATIAVERVAVNLRDFGEPDIAGMMAHDAVAADGPAAYLATVPTAAIRARLRAAGIPARLSDTAGTFLCNQLFYTLLHAGPRSGGTMRVGFLHVPAHPALVARQAGRLAEAPSMDMELMTEAARLAVEVAAPPASPLASPEQSRYILAGDPSRPPAPG